MNLLKYSNGYGHVIITVAIFVCCTALLIAPTDAYVKATAVSLMVSAAAGWAVTSSANTTAKETAQEVKQSVAEVVQENNAQSTPPAKL